MATINSGNSTTLYSTTQTTTSVNTASTLPAPKVNETNFTTLYSNSSASATGGGTSGNLLVSGNLRVLGTSDLEGAVLIGNSYTLPTSDGTNGQVVVTDGSGNLTFQNVSSLSSYAIQADTATGGANLTLVGTSTTDSVKFASGTNITVSRTDANTITISTVADNIPDGTAQGQVLYWDGSAWTANSDITSSAAADRFKLIYNNSTAGVSSALFLRKNFGATPFTTDDGVSVGLQIDSDSQALQQIANISATYDATTPEIVLSTNANANTTGPFVTVATFTSALATLPADLNVNGGNINLNGTATAGVQPFLTFETQADGSNPMYGIRGISTANDPWFVGSGSTGSDQGYLELATGDNAGGSNSGGQIYVRQYNGQGSGGAPWYGGGGTVVNELTLLDNLGYTSIPKRLGINNTSPNVALDVSGDVYVGGVYSQTGETLSINVDSTAADSYLYMKGTSKYLKWDNSGYFRLNDTLYGDADIIANANLGTNGNNIYFNNDDVSAADSYLTVKRGASADVSVRWNQATSRWQFTNDGTTYYDMVINLDDLADVVITPPLYNGQLLSYRLNGATGSWINDNEVIVTIDTERSSFRYRPLSPIAGYSSSLFLTKDYSAAATGSTGVGTYTDGSGVALGFSVDSDSQSIATFANIAGLYSTTNPSITLNTSTDNFSTNTQIASFDTSTTSLSAASLILSSENTGAAADSYLYANRGSTGADAFLQWSESNSWWGSSSNLFAANGVIGANYIGTNGNTIYFNFDDVSAADSFLTVKRGASPDVNIKWNEGTVRWQTTTDGTNYLNIPNQNLDTTDNVTFSQVTIDSRATFDTATITTTSTGTPLPLITSTRNVMNVLVYIVQGANTHCVNATVLKNGTNPPLLTTYGELYNNISLANFSADYYAPDATIRLLVNPVNATSMTFSAVRTSLT